MSDPTAPLDRAKAPRPVVKSGILDIAAYVPGKAKVEGVANSVKISANENILGSSPKAQAAFAEGAASLNLYPDGRASLLRAAIARRFRLEPERLVFGAGSDEIFRLIHQVFLEPGDNIIQGEFGFGEWAIGARSLQAEVRYAREVNYRVDVDEMLKLVDEHTRIVFIANPSNPTGTYVTGSEIRRLQAALPPSVVLVLDGAYAEFCTDPAYEDGLDLARTEPNVIVTRTFSKMHGLAALRIGWGYMDAEIVGAIDRIRLPFNTTAPAQMAAIAALEDAEFQQRSIDHVARWRPWLAQQIGGLGLEVTPSGANFVMVGFPATPGKTARDAEAYLGQRGLIVRGIGSYGLPEHLRITIGLEAHNRALVEALAEFVRS
jgi:histidinol-phosphate aminotransferase